VHQGEKSREKRGKDPAEGGGKKGKSFGRKIKGQIMECPEKNHWVVKKKKDERLDYKKKLWGLNRNDEN